MSKDKNLIMAVIATVGLIVAIYILYTQLKKDGYNGDIPPLPPDPGPHIPGTPQIWSWNYTQGPAKNAIWQLPGMVHLSSISGIFTIESLNPGAWFEKDVGIKIFAIRPNDEVEIWKGEPFTGYETGTFPFSAPVGIDDVMSIEVRISRLYGFGEDLKRITAVNMEALVVA